VGGSVHYLDYMAGKAIKIGEFPIPIAPGLTANLGLFLEFSLSGSISLGFSVVSVTGFEIIQGKPRFFQNAVINKSANISAHATAGVKGQVMLRILGLAVADVNVRVGVDLKGSLTTRSNPPPNFCVNVGGHVYLGLTALESGLVGSLLKTKISVDIWNSNNSPFKKSWHWEDYKLVAGCSAK